MNSILDNIKKSVESLEWSSPSKMKKAIELCISIYNLYIYDGGDFSYYRRLSKQYFISIIKTKSYIYEIKNNLIINKILIPDPSNSYDVKKGKGKAYKFNNDLINGNYTFINEIRNRVNGSDINLNNIEKYLINNINNINFQLNENVYNLYKSVLNGNINNVKIEKYIEKSFKKLKFKKEVNYFIDNYKLNRNDIKINNEIDFNFISLKLENDEIRVSLEKGIELAKKSNKDLILYKDKAYIENINDFIKRKEREIKLIFRKCVYEINNNIFRINRNETNRRLDYNLTNMKNELLDYLELDGEELVEIDISNAQFALLSYIVKDLDTSFIKKTQEGSLYNDDKDNWFRIAFDKVKKEHDLYRSKYPKTMKFIDIYKNNYGYKYFSIMLQNVESLIMIDYLLPNLINKYDIFTIHDAIRVKKSQFIEVKKEMEFLFDKIGFKCNIRNKKNSLYIKKETEIINYKGIKNVEIEKISSDDKKLFLRKIKELRDIGFEPSEYLIYSLNIFDKYKSWYIYNKWVEKERYKSIENY
jgi:hypothetical protein